jgi:hypothetical protein
VLATVEAESLTFMVQVATPQSQPPDSNTVQFLHYMYTHPSIALHLRHKLALNQALQEGKGRFEQ